MIFQFYWFIWVDNDNVPRGTFTLMKMIPDPSKEVFLICKDHNVSGETFELRMNSKFEFLHTCPKPAPDKLPEYYSSEDYISHTDAASTSMDKVYQAVKSWMLRKKIRWIKRLATGGSILDIGAGTGDFLLAAKKCGWSTAGIEPDYPARLLAAKKGIRLSESASGFKKSSFDVITMWHVLEHVSDLEEQIRQLTTLLKKDGLLVIAVPNFKSYDATHYGKYWAAFDVPRHLYHFSPRAVKEIFEIYSFELIAQRPLKFDSYYVSLLSERYKTGSRNPARAFLTGMLSNLKARSSGNYSSLAYFFRKN